jgi:hypothetical protein
MGGWRGRLRRNSNTGFLYPFPLREKPYGRLGRQNLCCNCATGTFACYFSKAFKIEKDDPMGNVQVIDAFLRQHLGCYYCDACLSKLTGVKPANQVNQTSRPLALNPAFSRKSNQKCQNCGKAKTSIAYLGPAPPATQN